MKNLNNLACTIRYNILKQAYAVAPKGVHIAPALSIVEILTVLFFNVMNYNKNNYSYEKRDRFILSKGHGALAYYAALYEAGIISQEVFLSYEQNGSFLHGQPSKNLKYGIEYSGGSLGLGLSYAIGIALSNESKKNKFNTYVLMGDGELNEGAVWESAMFIGHHRLKNIIVIVDRNSMQSDGNTSDILNFDIKKMWSSCGWDVIECNGHDLKELSVALFNTTSLNPRVIIANTIKGKGVSFMENSREWHHNRLTKELFEQAAEELRNLRYEYESNM
jgi:transketolase